MKDYFKIGNTYTVKVLFGNGRQVKVVEEGGGYAPFVHRFKLAPSKPFNKEDWL